MKTAALLALPVLLGAAAPAAGPKEWAKDIPYVTDFDLAIRQVSESGKILFIYNGWEGDRV